MKSIIFGDEMVSSASRMSLTVVVFFEISCAFISARILSVASFSRSFLA